MTTHPSLKSLLVCFALATSAPMPAMAANVVGGNCTTLGLTQLSDDRTGIIGCFLVTGTTGTPPSCTNASGVANGLCKWKNYSSSGGLEGCYTVAASPPATPCFGAACSTYTLKPMSGFSGSTSPGTVASVGAVNGYATVGMSWIDFRAVCKSGYLMTACSATDNAANYGGGFIAAPAIAYNNGCYASKSNQSGGGGEAGTGWNGVTTISLTCCKAAN